MAGPKLCCADHNCFYFELMFIVYLGSMVPWKPVVLFVSNNWIAALAAPVGTWEYLAAPGSAWELFVVNAELSKQRHAMADSRPRTTFTSIKVRIATALSPRTICLRPRCPAPTIGLRRRRVCTQFGCVGVCPCRRNAHTTQTHGDTDAFLLALALGVTP